MSHGAIVRRDHHGVVLRYVDPGELRAHHSDRRLQVSDRQRAALVAAERECLVLRVIAEHLDVSDIGMNRIDDALSIIRRALNSLRPGFGLSPRGFEG
jgi:hypothetical protein